MFPGWDAPFAITDVLLILVGMAMTLIGVVICDTVSMLRRRALAAEDSRVDVLSMDPNEMEGIR